MFGSRDNSSIQTLFSIEGRVTRLEKSESDVLKSLNRRVQFLENRIHEQDKWVDRLWCQNKLLMDYLNVRIESGDRIVPKDNAQG